MSNEKRLREVVTEVFASMQRNIAKPLNSWSTGNVIDVRIVEYWVDELEAALAETESQGETLPKTWTRPDRPHPMFQPETPKETK